MLTIVAKSLRFALVHLATIGLFAYLAVFGFLARRNRRLMHQFRNNFPFFKTPPRAMRLPEKNLSEIARAEACVLSEPESVQGNVTIFESVALNMIVAAFAPRAIFEIGTFDGRTTLNLALNAPADTKIYTIDLPKDTTDAAKLSVERSDQHLIVKNVTGERFLRPGRDGVRNRIVQLYGDTATFDFSPYYNAIDLVFVDGAHSYEYVVNDSIIAERLLSNKRGVILWHDYDPLHEGSIRAIEEFWESHPEYDMFHIGGTNIAGAIRA